MVMHFWCGKNATFIHSIDSWKGTAPTQNCVMHPWWFYWLDSTAKWILRQSWPGSMTCLTHILSFALCHVVPITEQGWRIYLLVSRNSLMRLSKINGLQLKLLTSKKKKKKKKKRGGIGHVQHHPLNFFQKSWDIYTISSVGIGNDCMLVLTIPSLTYF